jgi:hypothetical protein
VPKRRLAIVVCALLAGAAPEKTPGVPDDVIVKGKRLDPDIIVEGSRKTLTPGLWNLPAGPGTLTIKRPSDGGTSSIPATRWQACLPADVLTAQLSRLLVEGSVPGCSPIHFRMRGPRVIAGFRCDSFAVSEHADYGGMAKRNSIDLRFEKASERSGPGGEIVMTVISRLRAERAGNCAATDQPSPSIRNPIFAAATHQPALADDLPVAPAVMPRGVAVGDAAQPDDIVVVARKLMNLRLRYASDGRILTNCANTRPSGDVRIDRIGCAVLRACVASGSEEKDRTLACFNARIMSLVPGLHAAPAAQYRGKAGYIER